VRNPNSTASRTAASRRARERRERRRSQNSVVSWGRTRVEGPVEERRMERVER